jgi:hypothetical protein
VPGHGKQLGGARAATHEQANDRSVTVATQGAKKFLELLVEDGSRNPTLLLLTVGAARARSPRLERAASLVATIFTSPIDRYRIDCWTSTHTVLMLVEARHDSQPMVDRCRRVSTPQRGLACARVHATRSWPVRTVVTLSDFDLRFQHLIADVPTISLVPTQPDVDQEAKPIEQVERLGLDGQRAAVGRQQLKQVVLNGLD